MLLYGHDTSVTKTVAIDDGRGLALLHICSWFAVATYLLLRPNLLLL